MDYPKDKAVLFLPDVYGIQLINETQYQKQLESWPKCRSLIDTCREAVDAEDPVSEGNSAEANKACNDAYKFCFGTVWTDKTGVRIITLFVIWKLLTMTTARCIRYNCTHY